MPVLWYTGFLKTTPWAKVFAQATPSLLSPQQDSRKVHVTKCWVNMVCCVHPQKVEEAPSPRFLGAHLHPDNIPASFYEKKTKVSFSSSAGDVQLHTAATSIKLSVPQRTAAFPNVTPGFRCLVDDSGNSVRKRTDRRMDPALRKNVANVQSNCCSCLSVLVSFLSSLQVNKI